MKIIVAMDSFKGTLTAIEACGIVREAIGETRPEVAVRIKPMADGGEGTAAALVASRQGQWETRRVMGPLPDREVNAGIALFNDTREAVVEMAGASGITLLRPDELNPMRTTTFGTGQLIAAATELGVDRILLAVGGSATVDGGVGAAMALGWRFLDGHGCPVGLGGAELGRIAAIEPPERKAWPAIRVLSDVDNPLCGPHGAAQVYGPQKGATPAMVEELDAALSHLADLAEKRSGRRLRDLPGAGAAGGLAAGAVAFMDAELVPGIETVIRASGIEDDARDADWIVTGEGCFDGQSLRGKVVSGVVQLARRVGARVAVLAGGVEVPRDEYRRFGVEIALATRPDSMPLDEALRQAGPLLRRAAVTLARQHLG